MTRTAYTTNAYTLTETISSKTVYDFDNADYDYDNIFEFLQSVSIEPDLNIDQMANGFIEKLLLL